jgi:hypothetical protein
MTGNNRHLARIFALITLLVLCLLSGTSSIASAQELTIDGPTVSTPSPDEGYGVDSVVVRENSEDISVGISNYDQLEQSKSVVQIRRFNAYPTQIVDEKDATSFESQTSSFSLDNTSSGNSYWIVLFERSSVVDLLPVTVPGYTINPVVPGTAQTDEEITIQADLSEKGSQSGNLRRVEATIWNDNFETSVDLNSGDPYTKTLVPSEKSIPAGEYNVLISALGDKQKINTRSKKRNEPLAIKSAGTISISKSNDDDSGDDNNEDESDDEDSGGSGGQGGGGAAGGQGTGDSTTDGGPPTPQNVRDTLSLVDPTSEATINEDSSSTGAEENGESDGSQSSGNSESSVTAVEFEGETQHSVSVTDYGTPPQTVEEEVIDSIAAYNSGVNPASDSASDSGESADSDSETDESGSTADDGDSDVIEPNSSPSDSSDGSGDTDDGSDIRVVSLSDISPTEEIDDEETTATVTFSVDRNEVTNPNQLTVYKEEYVFEAQEEQWIELETSVSETTGEEVEVTAETTEFSLFAVTETISEQSQPSGSNNETATNSQNNSTGTTDQTPGFGITSVLLAILTVIGLSRHRK